MSRSTLRRILFLLVAILCIPVMIHAQTDGSSGGSGSSDGAKTPDSKVEKAKAKREWKKNRKQELEDARAKKEYNKKFNTKKTRRRMKKNEKKAARNNQHKREFFLVRWFRKMRH